MTKRTLVPILYQDATWVLVNKPVDLAIRAAHAGETGVVEWFALHHDLALYPCSDLDAAASGLLLCALTPSARKDAQRIHDSGQAGYTYNLISDRAPAHGSPWTCRTPLDGTDCATTFTLLREGRGSFFYRAESTQGHMRQIRYHASASGIPILGDIEHGGSAFPRLCAHCAELRWPGLSGPLVAEGPPSFHGLLTGRDSLLLEADIAYERRFHWLSSVTDAFRAIHRGEVQGQPFAVDVFGNWMCVTGFDETMPSESLRTSVQPILDTIGDRFGCRGGVVRTNRRDPHRRHLFGDVISWGDPPPETFLVREHDLQFEVALNDSQHVGLFLDQRDSRQRIKRIAAGRRVANLFAFTCSFSAAAAHAEAEVVFSVDLAAGCLARGKENFRYNNLTETGRGKFIQEDARKWLARQRRKEQTGTLKPWDLVICDPPVFASSAKGRAFSVEKEWAALAETTRAILSDQGIALFANNHRSGHDAFYLSELRQHFSSVIPLRPPLDFPDLPGVPPHVRIYWCSNAK